MGIATNLERPSPIESNLRQRAVKYSVMLTVQDVHTSDYWDLSPCLGHSAELDSTKASRLVESPSSFRFAPYRT